MASAAPKPTLQESSGLGGATAESVPANIVPAFNKVPQFIIPWEPWTRHFLRQFADQFRPLPPPLRLNARPAAFWPDVFVPERRSARGLAISALYHAAALAFMYLVPTLILLSRSPLGQAPQFSNQTITYYKVSEYLPAIHTASAPARVARQAEPKLAPQRVISLPQHADNREQTVLNPPSLRLLPQHVALPNMVVQAPVLAPPAAIPGMPPKLIFPFAPAQVVPPAVRVQVGAQVAQLTLRMRQLPEPSIIQPPPNVDLKPRLPGPINIASAEVEAPKLPAPAQRASGSDAKNMTQTPAAASAPPAPVDSARAGVAPPPIITGGSSDRAAGQLLALSLAPASVSGPIPVPNGNRHGEFAMGPEGKPEAAGTPEVKAGGNSSGGSGPRTGQGPEAAGSSAGITVAPGPHAPNTLIADRDNSGSAVIAQPRAATPATKAPEQPAPKQLAKVEPPRLPRIPAPDEGLEESVFGPKKYYSLMLNMPNLTSAGGSWIIRFAQLGENIPQGNLTAPVAVEKVDPAYPPDLMADGVEGVVTLYAIIRSDGTVADIRILRSLEQRLDRNAVHALEQWRFRPATRNGAPIDLEAVVQIPFRLRKASF